MKAEPRKEHEWLQRLVGEWRSECEATMTPDAPTEKSIGTESVRSIGGVWLVCEGQGQMPDGESATMIMTLGYDPDRGRFVGTWIGSMMTHLWVYDGELDPEGRVLTLSAQGPGFTPEAKSASYRDVIELVSDDHRILSSHTLSEDGTWNRFMTVHYYRTK